MAKHPYSPEQSPQSLALLPLEGALLLPHTHLPINIFEPRYIELVDHILATNRLVGLIQPSLKTTKSQKNIDLFAPIGTIARLVHFEEIDQEQYLIVLKGITRFRLLKQKRSNKPFYKFEVDNFEFSLDYLNSNISTDDNIIDKEHFLSVMRPFAEFVDLDIDWELVEKTNIHELVNFASMLAPLDKIEKQALLEAKTIADRAEILIALAELKMSRADVGNNLQ